jgi:Phage integrase, N-terminal SAM-like domain
LQLPGSQNWYILYRVNGRQIRESSGSRVKQVAIRLLQKRLGEREQGLPPAQELKRLRYEDVRQALLSDYELKGRHMLQRHADGSPKLDGLPHLDNFFAGRSAALISTQDLRAFILSRQKEGAQPSTINRNLALLRRMLNLAEWKGRFVAFLISRC